MRLSRLIQSFKFDSLSSVFYALARITEENNNENILLKDVVEVMLFESLEYSEYLYKELKDSLDKYYFSKDDIRKIQSYNNTKGEGYYIVIRGLKPVEKTYSK